MITLSDGVTTITLPRDLVWRDEHTWTPIVQSHNYSINGALIVETAEKLAGQPLTLTSPDRQALVSHPDLLQLKEWARIAGKQLTLTINNDVHTVLFRQQDTPIEANVLGYWAITDDQTRAKYFITLRFIKI